MFGSHARRVGANGWDRVIPLVPREKRPRLNGWSHYNEIAPTEAEISDWCRRYPDDGIGLCAGAPIIGIDIDRTDAEGAALAREIVDDELGPTALVRIGYAPKCMVFYRCDEPILSAKFHDIGVEVFGSSGQVVLFGIHPVTGREYTWPNQSPLTVHAAYLPSITADELVRAVSALQALLPRKASRHPTPRNGAVGTSPGLSQPTRCRSPGAYHRARGGDLLANMAAFMSEAELRHPAMISAVAFALGCGAGPDAVRHALLPAYLDTDPENPRDRIADFERALQGAIDKGFHNDVADLRASLNADRWSRF